MDGIPTNGADFLDFEPVPQPLPQLEELRREFMELKCVQDYMHQRFSGDRLLGKVLFRYFIGGVSNSLQIS